MGNIVYNTTYDALIDLLADYYGGYSSNGMQQIIDAGLTDNQIVDAINEIPNYHVVRNYDGTVRMTINTYGSGTTSSGANLAGQINSNAQAGTNSAKQTATMSAPAQTKYDSQTGTMTIEKNINSTTTKQFISKSVVPAIAATAVGLSTGKTISSAIYASGRNPWNLDDMSAYDPSTWWKITADMNGSFGEKALGTVFNLLFGIDPQTKQTQAYIDEDAYAYLAMYMNSIGFYGGDTWDGTQPSGWTVSQPMSPFKPVQLALQYDEHTAWNEPFFYGMTSVSGSQPNCYSGISFPVGNTIPDDLLCVPVYFERENTPALLFTSKSPFNCRSCYGYYATTWGVYAYGGGNASANADSFTYDDKTVYYHFTELYPNTTHPNTLTGYSTNNTTDLYPNIAWLSQYGTTQEQNPDGVGDQENAIYPVLDPTMSIADALNSLKSQYPNLWDNKETMDVAQPDGSVKTYTYIPIPYPTTKGQDDTQPTGDGQYQNQGNTAFDPDTANEFDYNDFMRLIDPDTPDYDYDDAGGEGDTPTPVTPTGSASALWKIYNPTQAQLDAFGAWLWSSDFVDQILKLFNDPMQAIIGLHKVFVTPTTSGSGAIKVGYLTSSANANYVSAQYVDLDCGSVDLLEYFGNVFDYDPHTKIRLYLPFIGIVSLDNSDVMRGKINVVYHVDVLTGTCLAEIKVTRDLAGGTLYTFSGNCAVQYPVSSGSYVGIVTGLLGIAGGIAGTIASGGALAPMLMGAGASVGAMHADVEHSGKISSNAGAMGIKKPYLIIERPQTKIPTNGENIEGLPQNKTVTLGSLSGRVKVKKCHYDGISCTANELDKIKALLESGVYIN